MLVFTTLYPNPAQPRLGIFVRNRVAAVAEHCRTRVVAPVLKRPGPRRGERRAEVPRRERRDGIDVYHPRFATLPGVARFADGVLLFLQTLSAVRRLRAEFPFELIDANYAFPDGTAAVLLGRRLGVPVSLTIRGGDIDLLTRFRMRRGVIRWTLRRADRVLAVSRHLANRAIALGASRERVAVIHNGIDPAVFSFLDQATARRRLAIPAPDRLVLSVANLIAEKGHHLLIEALARTPDNGRAPKLVILGSDQDGRLAYRRRLERQAARLGLTDRVHLAGSKPQSELRLWYSAADLLALPSFREGCPNVVREALACGAPVVASRVGGVPELITSDSHGLLVRPGDVSALAAAIEVALGRRWDRRALARAGGQRTWADVGRSVSEEFRRLAAASRTGPASPRVEVGGAFDRRPDCGG